MSGEGGAAMTDAWETLAKMLAIKLRHFVPMNHMREVCERDCFWCDCARLIEKAER